MACVRASGCIVSRRGVRASKSCLGDFLLRLVTLLPTLSSPGSLFSGLPQSSPPLSTPYGFPYYKSLLRRRFRSTVGAAIPPFSPLPTSGVYPLSVSLSSVYLCSLSRRLTLPQQQPCVPASAGPLCSA